MSEELKRRIVGAAVLLTVFSLIAWWIGSRGDDQEELPPSDAQIRNYDIRELERIAAAQSGGQAVPEPVLDVPIEPDELKARETEEAAEMQTDETPSSGKDTPVESSKVEPAPAPKPVSKPAPKPVTEPKPAPQPEQKTKPVPSAESKPEPKAAPPSSSKPETASNGKWVVQLASVTQKSGADNLSAKAGKKGWKSFVATGVVNGKTYYRVRVGPYLKREDADRAAALVAKDMGLKVAVMPR